MHEDFKWAEGTPWYEMRWSDEEKKTLARLWPKETVPVREIRKFLRGRSDSAVRGKAIKMNLGPKPKPLTALEVHQGVEEAKRPGQRPSFYWTPLQHEILVRMWNDKKTSVEEIALVLGVNQGTLYSQATRVGLTRRYNKREWKYRTPDDLTIMQRELLTYVRDKGPVAAGQADLEKIIGYCRSNLIRNLANLEEADLLHIIRRKSWTPQRQV